MINLGNKIRELRKQRGLTQEQLASALNVSPQAVSKWEMATSYPDMTLVPTIAAFFKVSLDTLFDYNAEEIETKINDIRFEADKYFFNDFKKSEKILLDGIAQYPSSDSLKTDLLELYYQHLKDRKELLNKLLDTGNKIISESTDIFCICRCKQMTASAYVDCGEYDSAKKIIDTLPYMYPYMLKDKMRVTAYLLKGNDRLKEASSLKIIENQELFVACDMEGRGYFEIGEYEKALKSFRQAAAVVEMFMKDDKYSYDSYEIGGTNTNHYTYYLEIAACLYRLGRSNEAEEAVARADFIIKNSNSLDFDDDYEDIMNNYRFYYKKLGIDEFRPLCELR